MPDTRRSPLLRYGVVFLAVAGAVLPRWPLWATLGSDLPFLFFWPVVIGCAWWGGFGPGLLATVLSGFAAALFLMDPGFSLAVVRPADRVGLAAFVVLGMGVSLLGEKGIRRGRKGDRGLGNYEERFRLLVEGVQDHGIFLLDPQGRVTTWNAGAERIQGYSAEEVIGRHFSRFYPPAAVERQQPEQELTRAGAEGRFEDEGWRVRKDGSRFWAHVVITALRDGSGRLRGFSKITRDLTERKQREEELRHLHDDLEGRVEERTAALATRTEELQVEVAERRRAEGALRDKEKQFHMLADSIPQLAWMARPDGHIYWYNRRWHDYTGTTAEEMEGWGWQGVHDPRELPTVVERWKASITSGEPFDMVFPLRGADGVFRPFLTRVLPVRGPGGEILHWFGTNTDITEIREMERALKEAARKKDEFLAVLAHELRNPLAPIRNGLQIMQLAENDRQAVQKARGMMERQIRHLTRIVDDLLDVSRIQRGKLTVRGERIDLAGIARHVVDDQRPGFERAGVALGSEIPTTPVWMMGDSTRLAQVMANVLSNAVKFTPRDGRVTVRLTVAEGGRQAELAVRDTGMGMDEARLAGLFDPFAQADSSLDRSMAGLGLGLALVKGLVELQGGTVGAASAGLGRGSEFTLRLPVQPEPAALSGMPAAPVRAAQRLRVLVVEDNRDAADSLRKVLELFGYEVTVSYTGPAGVTAAKAWHPDRVLCDIGLPGLDGYGVAAELRRDPEMAGTRMIAVTGYGADEDRQKSKQAGFDQHLVKPVDPQTLQEMIA